MNAIAKTWTACVSALQLDRLRMGEAVADDVRAHVAGCERCTRAMDELKLDEPLPPLRVVPIRRNVWPRVVGGLCVAAAASVMFVLWPGGGIHLKGANGPSLQMYARHFEQVRRVEPGETVSGGDAVRFAVTLREPAYIAVLSLDPRGGASVYVPVTPMQAGEDVPLPVATRLDATAGEETIVGVFCARPFDAGPLRAALEAGTFPDDSHGGHGAAFGEHQVPGQIPEGCQVTRWSFVKR